MLFGLTGVYSNHISMQCTREGASAPRPPVFPFFPSLSITEPSYWVHNSAPLSYEGFLQQSGMVERPGFHCAVRDISFNPEAVMLFNRCLKGIVLI